MSQFIISIIISTLAILISLASYWLSFKMRKKDFQLALMKEQLLAGQKTVGILLNVHEVLNGQYRMTITPIIIHKGLDKISEVDLQQSQASILLNQQGFIDQKFREFQLQYSILPDSVLHAALD